MAVAPSIFILRLAASLNTETQTPTAQVVGVRDLKKGMKIKATVVTDEEHTIVESNKMALGQAPQITVPPTTGVLLFLTPSESQVTLASAEQPADMLPETGSSLPLTWLLGTLVFAMSVALGIARRSFARG